MKTWLCAKPRGLLGLLMISVLVVGGLGWVSTAALRLEQDQASARAQSEFTEKRQTVQRERDQQARTAERERQQQQRSREREQQQQEAQVQAEFAGRLRLAMWRLDSRIARVLAREDSRPYNHYSAVFTPSVALDVRGKRVADGAVLEPSPLLSVELPDWMLLHFQTAPETGWGSPQVLPGNYQSLLAKNHICFNNVTRQRIQLLKELSTPDTTQMLVEGIGRQELQFANSNDLVANLNGNTLLLRNPQEIGQPTDPKNQGAQNPKQLQGSQPVPMYGLGTEYPNRVKQGQTVNYEAQKNAYSLEDSNILIANTRNTTTWAAQKPSATALAQVSVSLSPMVPLWLETPSQERLVVARLVRISSPAEEQLTLLAAWPPARWPVTMAALGTHEKLRQKAKQPRLVCQGIVLDWPHLEKMLAEEVRDLFPKAKVRPLHDTKPPHPERTMTALPVELDPGETAMVPPAPAEPVDPQPALPELPEAVPETIDDLGWTPLRIGLALAWAAALVALTAVGLGGWSLLDLSERRIRFVSAVTHELRTPLTTLRLYLDMLTGGLVKTEEQRAQYLHTLHAETERLNRLVGNVLDFSRLEKQRPRLELAPLCVGDFLSQLRTNWQTRCTDTEKVLEMENALSDGHVLVTDVNLLQQIVGNLIDNACKYSRGAEDPHIWVRLRLGDGGVMRIAVEDRGPGVKLAERSAIFRPFHRGRDCEVAGGVGLGLALAQRWAGLLGGRLLFEVPAGGVGACFVLELKPGA